METKTMVKVKTYRPPKAVVALLVMGIAVLLYAMMISASGNASKVLETMQAWKAKGLQASPAWRVRGVLARLGVLDPPRDPVKECGAPAAANWWWLFVRGFETRRLLACLKEQVQKAEEEHAAFTRNVLDLVLFLDVLLILGMFAKRLLADRFYGGTKRQRVAWSVEIRKHEGDTHSLSDEDDEQEVVSPLRVENEDESEPKLELDNKGDQKTDQAFHVEDEGDDPDDERKEKVAPPADVAEDEGDNSKPGGTKRQKVVWSVEIRKHEGDADHLSDEDSEQEVDAPLPDENEDEGDEPVLEHENKDDQRTDQAFHVEDEGDDQDDERKEKVAPPADVADDEGDKYKPVGTKKQRVAWSVEIRKHEDDTYHLSKEDDEKEVVAPLPDEKEDEGEEPELDHENKDDQRTDHAFHVEDEGDDPDDERKEKVASPGVVAEDEGDTSKPYGTKRQKIAWSVEIRKHKGDTHLLSEEDNEQEVVGPLLDEKEDEGDEPKLEHENKDDQRTDQAFHVENEGDDPDDERKEKVAPPAYVAEDEGDKSKAGGAKRQRVVWSIEIRKHEGVTDLSDEDNEQEVIAPLRNEKEDESHKPKLNHESKDDQRTEQAFHVEDEADDPDDERKGRLAPPGDDAEDEGDKSKPGGTKRQRVIWSVEIRKHEGDTDHLSDENDVAPLRDENEDEDDDPDDEGKEKVTPPADAKENDGDKFKL